MIVNIPFKTNIYINIKNAKLVYCNLVKTGKNKKYQKSLKCNLATRTKNLNN